MPKIARCALLLIPFVAGCSYPRGPGSSNLVDGSYHGRPVLQAGTEPTCPGTHYGYFEVADRDLHFAYQPDIVFDVPVQPDGTLHDVQGKAVLDGKAANDSLVLTVTTPDCRTFYSTGFIWNHS